MITISNKLAVEFYNEQKKKTDLLEPVELALDDEIDIIHLNNAFLYDSQFRALIKVFLHVYFKLMYDRDALMDLLQYMSNILIPGIDIDEGLE